MRYWPINYDYYYGFKVIIVISTSFSGAFWCVNGIDYYVENGRVLYYSVSVLYGKWRVNPFTPMIWLLILPSSCYIFPHKLVTRIWCLIKVTSCTWWVWVFSLPVYWTMHGYYRENWHVHPFWEFKDLYECKLWEVFFFLLCTFSKFLVILHSTQHINFW